MRVCLWLIIRVTWKLRCKAMVMSCGRECMSTDDDFMTV